MPPAIVRRGTCLALAIGLSGCGVPKADFDAKSQEAETAKHDLEAAKHQIGQLQQQLTAETQQETDLKASLGMAQSQAITDDQKAQLEEAKHAVEEAQERGKLLDDLQTKFKKPDRQHDHLHHR